MTFQLAENYYQIPGLAKKLARKNNLRYIRPKETDLLALLEADQIDYLFIYRSVAAQHGLKILLLPDEVNLKSPALSTLYSTASVRVTGKKPGEYITRIGEPMVYSVTIPKNAPNQKAAQEWIELLLSPRGQAIMKDNGQPCITPPIADGFGFLPENLKPLCRRNDSIQGEE
jgi:molybdate/tungstate transport system substrate-binding protein